MTNVEPEAKEASFRDVIRIDGKQVRNRVDEWVRSHGACDQDEVGWGEGSCRLMEGRYKKCPMVTVVCDNLNTHTIGAFY